MTDNRVEDDRVKERNFEFFLSNAAINVEKMNHIETETLTFISLYLVAVSLGMTLALGNNLPDFIEPEYVIAALLAVGVIPYIFIFRWNKFYQSFKNKWVNCTRECWSMLQRDDSDYTDYCEPFNNSREVVLSKTYRLHIIFLLMITMIELITMIVLIVN